MTLAELHRVNVRRYRGQGTTAETCGLRLVNALAKKPAGSMLEVILTGHVAGFGWAHRHRLIVFHREVWQVSKLGREYLALLENPRSNLADVNSFLERARAETLA